MRLAWLLLVASACGAAPAEPPDPSATPPSVPRFVRASPGDGEITLAWAPNPEADLVGYDVRIGGVGGLQRTDATHLVVRGLTNGVPVQLEVAAVAATGLRSGYSAPVQAIPIPPDLTPPALVASLPENGATGVDPVAFASVVQIQLDEPVDRGALDVRISPGFDLGERDWAIDDTIVRFVPAGRFLPGTHYVLSLGISDRAGNRVTRTIAFDTRPVPPAVDTLSPAPNATGVPVGTPVAVHFSQPMETAIVTLEPAVALTCDDWNPARTRVGCTLGAPLAGDTVYRVRVGGTSTGTSGLALGVDVTSSFRTGTAPDTTAPTVVSTSPAAGATGVPLDAEICVTFSEPMDQAAAEGAFTIPSPPERNAGVRFWRAPETLCFDGAYDIAYNDVVQIAVGTGARDLAGNPLAAPFASTFTAWRLESRTIPAAQAGTVTEEGFVFPGEAYVGYGSAIYGRVKAYFSFPLPPLPEGGVLRRARLRLRQSAPPIGAPYSEGGQVKAMAVDYGPSLEAGDYAGPTVGSDLWMVAADDVLGARSIDFTRDTQDAIEHGRTPQVELLLARSLFYQDRTELTFWDDVELVVEITHP